MGLGPCPGRRGTGYSNKLSDCSEGPKPPVNISDKRSCSNNSKEIMKAHII